MLVTRPQPQGERLSANLQALGAESFCLPMVEIQPLDISHLPILKEEGSFNKIVAISIPAAELALKQLPPSLFGGEWFTPGNGTAKALSAQGIQAHFPDSEFTSEAMLALPQLQSVDNEQILLLKGEGGRTMLADTLTSRGAQVSSLELYRRACPEYPAGTLDLQLNNRQINAVVATSSQIVSHLLQLSDTVRTIPCIVPSERIANEARDRGLSRVVVSQSAGDQDIADSLLQLL